MPNPFGSTFESFGAPRGPLVESVHQDQFENLSKLLDSGDGQLMSLRAPRAGYGKTMLLSRLKQARQAGSLFVPIHLSDGRRVEGELILEEILTQMSEVLPAGGGLTRLDLHTRRLFAQGLIPMVHSGEVPCQDREAALASLLDRPTEAFDFHHEGAAIAQWSREHFSLLGPRLSAVLSKASGSSGRDVGYWADLFFNYAIRPPSDVARVSDLMDAVFGERSRFHSGAGFLEGLGSFLNLIMLVEPVVLILDEVEGLSSDSDAALRAACCLTSLWESAPRVSVILSVNDDVWNSAFVPRLPLGLRDRLEDIVIRLDSLSEEEAKALITVRAGDESVKIFDRVDFDVDALYPRGVLRQAREAWDHRDEEIPAKNPELSVPPPVLVVGEQTIEVASSPTVAYRQHLDVASELQVSQEPTPGTSPSQFGTHPSAKLAADLRIDTLDIDDQDVDFAFPTYSPRQAHVSPFAAAATFVNPPQSLRAPYPPAPVKRPSLPRRYAVQRLVRSVNYPQQAAAPPQAMTPPWQEQIISPFTNTPVGQSSPQPAQSAFVQQSIASPFAVNKAPEQIAPAQALPPARPMEEPAPHQAAPAMSGPFGVASGSQVNLPPTSQPFRQGQYEGQQVAVPQGYLPEQIHPVTPAQQPVPYPPAQSLSPQQKPVDQTPRLAENADAIDNLLRQFRTRNDR